MHEMAFGGDPPVTPGHLFIRLKAGWCQEARLWEAGVQLVTSPVKRNWASAEGW